jgi:hypothetical protein
MASSKDKEESYLKEVLHFYFSPELRTIGTLIYFGVFGYFTLYYIDNIFLTFKFMLYILLGHTALSGTGFLFAGVIFVLSLIMPFFISFYSIFVLHRVWDKRSWSGSAKWITTGLIVLVSLLIIVVSDNAARAAARKPAMQSFIEDANLTGKL